VIGVLLGGGFFFVFMALIAGRSVRRMATKAPILDAPLSETHRAATRSVLMERAVATGILVALTVHASRLVRRNESV
jgi:hypothetical protein